MDALKVSDEIRKICRDKGVRLSLDALLESRRTGQWNTALAAVARFGTVHSVRVISKAIDLMKLLGVALDWHTYAHLLRAQCRSRKVNEAEKTFAIMEAEGMPGNDVTYNTLIDGYMRMSDLGGILKTIRRMDAAGVAADRFTMVPLFRLTAEQGSRADMERTRADAVARGVWSEERSHEEVKNAYDNVASRAKRGAPRKATAAPAAETVKTAVGVGGAGGVKVKVATRAMPGDLAMWCGRIAAKTSAEAALVSLQRAVESGLFGTEQGRSALPFGVALGRVVADTATSTERCGELAVTATFLMESCGVTPNEDTLVKAAQVVVAMSNSTQRSVLLSMARSALLPLSLARVFNVFVEDLLQSGDVDEALELSAQIARNTETVSLFATYEPLTEPIFAGESRGGGGDMPPLLPM